MHSGRPVVSRAREERYALGVALLKQSVKLFEDGGEVNATVGCRSEVQLTLAKRRADHVHQVLVVYLGVGRHDVRVSHVGHVIDDFRGARGRSERHLCFQEQGGLV